MTQTEATTKITELAAMLARAATCPDFDDTDRKVAQKLGLAITAALQARDARKLTKLCNHVTLASDERISAYTIELAIYGEDA